MTDVKNYYFIMQAGSSTLAPLPILLGYFKGYRRQTPHGVHPIRFVINSFVICLILRLKIDQFEL